MSSNNLVNISAALILLVTICNYGHSFLFSRCPTRQVISPFPPPRISTPQPPYGCSQVTRLTKKNAFICFSEDYRRKMRNRQKLMPDVGVPVQQVITNHGYPVETHNVNTEDEYILTLIRIPHGKYAAAAPKGPVLLTHGMLASSAQWVLNVPDEKSLAFLLANNGYDVWLDNSRGTKYSQGHISLNAKYDPKYWDFSWHEMGKYDLPATIDHILTNYTDKRLFFIGHSMGTTMFFTGLSLTPSYNNKIKTAYLMAPSAYLGNSTNLVHWITLAAYYSQPLLKYITRGPLFPSGFARVQNISRYKLGPACYSNPITCTVCVHSMFYFNGYDYEQLNFDQLRVLLYQFPDEASTKTLIHYAQSMVTGEFREFDFGPYENPRRYNGRCTPPSYNLSNVKVPVMTFWSWNDNFVTPKDVAKLRAKLNIVTDVEIPHCAFTHLDFAIANDADKFIYKKILKSMDNFKIS